MPDTETAAAAATEVLDRVVCALCDCSDEPDLVGAYDLPLAGEVLICDGCADAVTEQLAERQAAVFDALLARMGGGSHE